MGTRRNFTAADGVSLREYFDTRLDAVERATDLAAHTLEKRLEGMNEFRSTLKDQAAKFVTRDELCIQLRPIIDELRELKSYKDAAVGKASQQSVTTAQFMAVLGLVISLISLLSRLAGGP